MVTRRHQRIDTNTPIELIERLTARARAATPESDEALEFSQRALSALFFELRKPLGTKFDVLPYDAD